MLVNEKDSKIASRIRLTQSQIQIFSCTPAFFQQLNFRPISKYLFNLFLYNRMLTL